MSSKGLFEPLDELIERDSAETQEFYDNVSPKLEGWLDTYGSPDGSTYFVPGGYNTVVMYLNREVFDAAGVEMPDTDWTWDEFRATAETIKEKTGAFMTTAGRRLPLRPDPSLALHQRGQHPQRGLGHGNLRQRRGRRGGGVREGTGRG